jgi:hypothetical protein
MSASRVTSATSILPLSGSNAGTGEQVGGRRKGHLPLSSDVVALAPNDAPALDVVNQFVDHLAELPLIAWLAIGRELSADGSLSIGQSAWIEVETAIAAQRLGMGAWYIRDAIETAICLASRQTSRWSREERCQFASAHGAAEAAALALLARQHISTVSFRALCAPFREFENQQP